MLSQNHFVSSSGFQTEDMFFTWVETFINWDFEIDLGVVVTKLRQFYFKDCCTIYQLQFKYIFF